MENIKIKDREREEQDKIKIKKWTSINKIPWLQKISLKNSKTMEEKSLCLMWKMMGPYVQDEALLQAYKDLAVT